ncbi:MAG: ABC transporter permease [Vicinamibacterales bacterium]
MLHDLRHALRQLRKRPGFAAVAIATLGLGIGLAAAMFGLVQGVLLSPPPYQDPDRLVLITTERADGPYRRGSSVAHWVAWREARAIEPPALYRWTFSFLVRNEGSESMGGMVVTPDYFRTLGLAPVLGRGLTAEDAARSVGEAGSIVIGHHLWQQRFGGTPDVIGRSIQLSRVRTPMTIVGVMPEGVRFLPDPGAASEPNYDLNARVDFWLAMAPDESRPRSQAGNAVSRLRPGTTIEQARAEIAAIADGVAGADTAFEGLSGAVTPLLDALNRDARRLIVPLFGSVMLVFFIACANVSGLLLARAFERQQEYTLRSALGAERWRLIRLVLAESLVLALVSAIAGGLLAAGIVRGLDAIAGRAVPRLDAVSVGLPVVAFGLIAAVMAAVVSGILPALRTSSVRQLPLMGSRGTASRADRRWLGAVAVLQIVLTIALLGGAALLVRSAGYLDGVHPGYRTERILAMTVTAVQPNQWRAFHTQALERVAALPGISHAAFAWGVPLTGNKWPADVDIPGLPGAARLAEQVSLPLRAVTPGYFDLFGIALVEGRGFRDSDNGDAPAVAIVNEALARRYFADGGAVGRRMHYTGRPDESVEIVGVVADTRTEALGVEPEPEIYMCLWQNGAFSKHLVLRTEADPLSVAASVRDAIREVDPTAAVEHVTTMDEIRRASLAPQRFATRLLAGFAVAATLLAAIGLYGVLSLSVGARTKEIAVRRAVGAQSHQIVSLVVTEVLRMMAVGLALGALAAVAMGRGLRGLLYGVNPGDPVAIASVAVLFTLVAALAALVPARRAGQVDPVIGLREE